MEPTNSFNWEPPVFERKPYVVPYFKVNLVVTGRDIMCIHNHNTEAYGLFWFPDGCFCFEDQIQALCIYHAERSAGDYPMFPFIYWGA
jgi:hypothetical protein